MQTKKQAMPFTLGLTLITFLLFAYYVSTWRNAFNFRSAIDSCSETFCDFATYYYPMGESIFHTRLPIEGFVYSPFIAILFALFVPLGSDIALLLWGILQGVFILLYIALFRRLIPAGQWIQYLFVFLTLSSFPILHHLAWGQVGIITTVSILGALFFYERGQRAIAAVLLAFGMSFKFFPLIFFLPFFIRRDVRFLLYSFTACAIFLFVIPIKKHIVKTIGRERLRQLLKKRFLLSASATQTPQPRPATTGNSGTGTLDFQTFAQRWASDFL